MTLTEMFLGPSTVEADEDLLWKEVLREGRWETTPDARTGKAVLKPLLVVPDKSDKAKGIIGMADLVKSFEDGSHEFVTIPETHGNAAVENTGYVKKLKIDTDENGKSRLWAGMDFTELDIKGKVERGSIAGSSCGIVFDHVRTGDAKVFPIAIEHIALTNKPWIDGMKPFGLSDEAPDQSLCLADDTTVLDDPLVENPAEVETVPPVGSDEWAAQDTFAWRHTEIDNALAQMGDYNLVGLNSDFALVDDANGNLWEAPFEIEDGVLKLSDQEDWKRHGETPEGDETLPDASGGSGAMASQGDDEGFGLSEAEERAIYLASLSPIRRSRVLSAERLSLAIGWNPKMEDYSPSAWIKACALDRGSGAPSERYSLPFRDPSGSVNRIGLAAAAGRFNQVSNASAVQKEAAKRKLLSAYKEVGADPPPSLGSSAQIKLAMAQEQRKMLLLGVSPFGVTGPGVQTGVTTQFTHPFEEQKHPRGAGGKFRTNLGNVKPGSQVAHKGKTYTVGGSPPGMPDHRYLHHVNVPTHDENGKKLTFEQRQQKYPPLIMHKKELVAGSWVPPQAKLDKKSK